MFIGRIINYFRTAPKPVVEPAPYREMHRGLALVQQQDAAARRGDRASLFQSAGRITRALAFSVLMGSAALALPGDAQVRHEPLPEESPHDFFSFPLIFKADPLPTMSVKSTFAAIIKNTPLPSTPPRQYYLFLSLRARTNIAPSSSYGFLGHECPISVRLTYEDGLSELRQVCFGGWQEGDQQAVISFPVDSGGPLPIRVDFVYSQASINALSISTDVLLVPVPTNGI